MSTSAFDRIVDALRDAGTDAGTTVNVNSRTARARCPAHNGNSATSLALTAIEGSVLIHCHAGCDTDDVLAALNLTLSDLFDNPRGQSYLYPDGRIVDRRPRKKFTQRGNRKGNALFRADRIAKDATVYVPEGEKDVLAIESVGGVAVCSSMGAGKAYLADWSPVAGKHVVIIADDDEPGYKHANDVAELLKSIAASTIIVRAAVGKDVSDHIAAGKGLDELVTESLLDKLGVTSEWLEAQTFPELEEVMPGLIVEGVTVLSGPPKVGKSFLVANIAIAVVSGDKALGTST